MLQADPHAAPRRWAMLAALFFAVVILWVLWERYGADMFWTRPPTARPPVPMPARTPGGDTAMPVEGPGMRVDRIEPRKYRRAEGSVPPPAGRR